MSSITQSFPLDWMESVSSRMLSSLTPKTQFFMSCQSKTSLESCQWSLLETLELFRSNRESPVTGLTATVPTGVGMDALCGMSTRGLWDGPVTYNGGRCHMKPCFQTFCFILVIIVIICASIAQIFPLDWLGSVCSLGKLPVVPVGNTGTIPFLS